MPAGGPHVGGRRRAPPGALRGAPNAGASNLTRAATDLLFQAVPQVQLAVRSGRGAVAGVGVVMAEADEARTPLPRARVLSYSTSAPGVGSVDAERGTLGRSPLERF